MINDSKANAPTRFLGARSPCVSILLGTYCTQRNRDRIKALFSDLEKERLPVRSALSSEDVPHYLDRSVNERFICSKIIYPVALNIFWSQQIGHTSGDRRDQMT